ncbi:MAG: hypothetical protein AAF725_11765 [Acidobacteriota bacterium]
MLLIDTLREISRWSHALFGFTGLVAFWFPVFARKGGRLHRVAGKVFVYSGYWVTVSAGFSCCLLGWKIRSGGARGLDPYATVIFLAYLAWVTFVMLRYSIGVLRTKKDPTRLDTPGHRFLANSALVASLSLVAIGLMLESQQKILLFALAPIGLTVGLPMRRYMRGDFETPRAWFYEHMSATLGAGIAFHTAFAVFGASRIFTLPTSGLMSILPWLLPTLVGTPTLVLWRRHYRRKFGDLAPRLAA